MISDLEWKIIYVGAAESEEYDQTLETILVGPVPCGRHKFVFQVVIITPLSMDLCLPYVVSIDFWQYKVEVEDVFYLLYGRFRLEVIVLY